VATFTIERFVRPWKHISVKSARSKTKTKDTQQWKRHDHEQQAHLSNTRKSFRTHHSTIAMSFTLVAAETGSAALAALSILSNLFLAALFTRHVAIPSALQTLDWTRSTLSFPENTEFTAKIEKRCDEIVELALITPVKSCARSCKERWRDLSNRTRHTLLQLTSLRLTIEHRLDLCAGVLQYLRQSFRDYRTVLEILAIRWFYHCIKVRLSPSQQLRLQLLTHFRRSYGQFRPWRRPITCRKAAGRTRDRITTWPKILHLVGTRHANQQQIYPRRHTRSRSRNPPQSHNHSRGQEQAPGDLHLRYILAGVTPPNQINPAGHR
jgi:hypothetical protein